MMRGNVVCKYVFLSDRLPFDLFFVIYLAMLCLSYVSENFFLTPQPPNLCVLGHLNLYPIEKKTLEFLRVQCF